LEAIRILGLEKKTKFYQASTSEMFGKVYEPPPTTNRKKKKKLRIIIAYHNNIC
jgi:GDP-D-mannose dehydratase